MKPFNAIMFALSILLFSGCQMTPVANGCTINGPIETMPEQVKRVQLGMTKSELEAVMGEADYSPIEGVFYFSTGGDCLLDEVERVALCGIVAEFRDYSADEGPTDSLQSCWWGAIGE